MVCKKCGNEESNESKFCSACGGVLEPETEEKVTEELTTVCCHCGFIFDVDDQQFCPKCGKKRKKNLKNCPQCNAPVLNQEDVFCSVCGKQYEQHSISEIVKENEFVKSVGADIRNSQSIQQIKKSVHGGINKINTTDKNTKKKILIASSIIVPIIILIIIICNIHVCEECEETYFGEKNILSFWGETAYVCDDCYEDYWY